MYSDFSDRLNQYRKRELPSASLSDCMANLNINHSDDLEIPCFEHPMLGDLVEKKVNRLKSYAKTSPNSPWLKQQLKRMQRGTDFLKGQVNENPLFWLGWANHFRLFFWSDFVEMVSTKFVDKLAVKCLLNGCRDGIPSVDRLLDTVFTAQLKFIKRHNVDQHDFALRMRQLQAIFSILFATHIHRMDDLPLMFKALAEEYRRKNGKLTFFANDLLVTIRPQQGGFTIDRLFAQSCRGYHLCRDAQVKDPLTLNAEIGRTWPEMCNSSCKWSIIANEHAVASNDSKAATSNSKAPSLKLISLMARSLRDHRLSLEQLTRD